MNPLDDSITLKFFVRAPNYSQHCQDQERYIETLKRQMSAKDTEIGELKAKSNFRPVQERRAPCGSSLLEDEPQSLRKENSNSPKEEEEKKSIDA